MLLLRWKEMCNVLYGHGAAAVARRERDSHPACQVAAEMNASDVAVRATGHNGRGATIGVYPHSGLLSLVCRGSNTICAWVGHA